MSLTETVVVKDPHGIHLRAAVNLILVARKYKSRITLKKGPETANAQSILGLMGLAASRGTELEIISEGEDAGEALAELKELIGKANSLI